MSPQHSGAERLPFTIKPGAREALMNGQWDPIGQLLDASGRVKDLAANLPYLHF